MRLILDCVVLLLGAIPLLAVDLALLIKTSEVGYGRRRPPARILQEGQ